MVCSRENDRDEQKSPCLLMPEDVDAEVVDDFDEVAVALRAGRLVTHDEPEPRLGKVERVVRWCDVPTVRATRRVGPDTNGQAADLRHGEGVLR